MAQTLPLRVQLLSTQTGLTLTHRVLNLDGTEFAAATTGLAETAVAGEYTLLGGYSAPDAGGYVEIAIQAGALLGTAKIDPAAPTVSQIQSGLATAASIAALNNLSAAQVNAEVDAALVDYDAPTFAELDARIDAIDAAIASLDDLNSTQVQAAVNAALVAYDVATSADVTTANCGDGTFEFTYTLTSTATGQPIPDATIRITTDVAGANTVWTGATDVLGVARNPCSDKPRLVAGQYFIFRSLSGYTFNDPDVEVIS